MNIPAPYLVYLGAATDSLSIKTSRGVADWRRELCIGQRRLPGCHLTLGLEDLSYPEAVARRKDDDSRRSQRGRSAQ